MKKLMIIAATFLAVILSAAVALAGDYPSEQVFYAPDGVRSAHRKTTQVNFLAPQVWTAEIAVTPPAPGQTEETTVEDYDRTVRHSGRTDYAYCSPKNSNTSDSYVDKVSEHRKTVTKKKDLTKTIHANSGAKDTAVSGAIKGFGGGLGEGLGNSLTPWGRGVAVVNKLVNAPGPTTINGTNTGIVKGTNTGTVNGTNTLGATITTTSAAGAGH